MPYGPVASRLGDGMLLDEHVCIRNLLVARRLSLTAGFGEDFEMMVREL